MENNPDSKQPVQAPPLQPIPEKTLFSWKAAARPFKKRTREFYSTVGVIVLLLSVILFVAREFLLIGVILSLAFIIYALGSVEPEKIKFSITNKGVRMGPALYPMHFLGRFWFEEKWGQHVVMLEHFGGMPSILMLVIKKEDKKKIEKSLSSFLIKQKPEPTTIDKMATWMQKKIPLES